MYIFEAIFYVSQIIIFIHFSSVFWMSWCPSLGLFPVLKRLKTCDIALDYAAIWIMNLWFLHAMVGLHLFFLGFREREKEDRGGKEIKKPTSWDEEDFTNILLKLSLTLQKIGRKFKVLNRSKTPDTVFSTPSRSCNKNWSPPGPRLCPWKLQCSKSSTRNQIIHLCKELLDGFIV